MEGLQHIYPVTAVQVPSNPGQVVYLYEAVPLKTLKELKQASTTYGPMVSFTLG